MKPSRFNVIAQKNSDDALLYNAFSGAIAKMSYLLYDLIITGNDKIDSLLPNDLIKKLEHFGFIVDDSLDEIDRYEKIHMEWKSGGKVVNFNVLLTYDCNFACPYCYQGRGEEGKRIHNFSYMPDNIYKQTVSFIKNTARDKCSESLELVLYGGEPFLVANKCKLLVDEIASWCRESGIEFKLHALSNGSLLNEDVISWLSAYKCRLQIPIDGAKEMHDKYRFYLSDRSGSYEKLMHVLAQTKNTNVETHLRISLTNETYPTIIPLLDDLSTRNLTHVYPDFCYITAFTAACDAFKSTCLTDNKLFEILPELWRNAYRRGFSLDHVKPSMQPLPCSSIADGSYIIDPFGDVYKCWELVGLKQHCVGTLKNNGELEKTSRYADVINRNPVKIEKCRNHNYLPTCGGGCVCKAYWNEKTYHASGCGTDFFLLRDKIKMQEEINPSVEYYNYENYVLNIIQDVQPPSIRHCYVLV
jgi:uncharacterized protein